MHLINHSFEQLRSLAPLLLGSAMLVLSACGGSSDDSPQGSQPDIAQRFQQVLDTAVERGLPAISLTVRNDQVEFSGTAGMVDQTSQTPTSSSDRFYIASVGKTFLAATTLQMVEDGLLTLDDKMTDLLPGSITSHIPSSDQISLRMLLNHTSGIYDFQNDGEEWDQDFQALGPEHQWTNAEALTYAYDHPLHFSPGTSYRYSNTNYVLIALIIEAVTGQSVDQSIRARIIEPLGLSNTYHGDEASGVAGLVHGYVDVDGEALDVHPWYDHYGVADAGIQSTTEDMARFIEALVKHGSVLGETMLAEMLNPSAIGEPASNYGLGITILPTDLPDMVIYRHNGKDPGAQALMMYISGKETSITIAASASFDDYDLIFDLVTNDVFALLEELENES